MDHSSYMQRCRELALLGRGKVGNGALVGSVLVRGDEIVSDGYHISYGNLHAERISLEKFEQKIESSDVLYTTLEPCCHHGKTPPCTDYIIERGVKTVVFGMEDPDERVAGQGNEILRKAGITVIGPVDRALHERMSRGFMSVRTKKRPWITLKKAMTKDGRTANANGERLIITDKDQDVWSHTFLRSESDAILVGVQTIVRDNPLLNTRLSQVKYSQEGLNPYRVILDPHLRIPLDAHVITDDERHRTMVITSDANKAEHAVSVLRDRGVRVLFVPTEAGDFVLPELWKQLLTPVGEYHGLTSVLIEGGQRTWDIFKGGGVVDEEVVLMGQ